MDAGTVQWEKTVLFSSGNMRTDLFRPMRRSVSDLNVCASKPRKDKPVVLETRQARAGSHVPVVSVQYDVPHTKTPPNSSAFRYKRLHTPLAYQNSFKRSKSDEKINHLNNTVDNHRLKGLGVGKCYEYYPPPTAPDHVRAPIPVTPATTPGNSRLGTYQSFSPSQYFPCQDIASLKNAHDRLNKELQNEGQGQLNYVKQWQNVKGHLDEQPISRKSSKRFTYLQSPLKFSQTPHENHRDESREDSRSVHKGQGHTSQGSIQGDDMYGYNKVYSMDCTNQQWLFEKNGGAMLPTGGMRGRYLFRRSSTSHQESVKLRLITVQQRPVSITLNSSSTPTVPYSTADILYGNEVSSRGNQGEEGRQNSFVDGDRAKPKIKDIDYPGNIRRPGSKSGTRKSLSIDAVSFDKDKDDQLKGLSATLPPTTKTASHFRPNGIRSNILKGEQLYTAKHNGATNGKEPDDLVAMGTLWSPNNGQQSSQQQQLPPTASSVDSSRQTASRSNSLSNNTNTNSFPSKVTSSSSNVHNSLSSSNNTVSSQRKYPSNSVRPIVNVQNNVSGKKNSNVQKEQEEPKYTDPMIGAPPSFQQRIIELGALEGDTVRWERSKRLKKKKQDRDS